MSWQKRALIFPRINVNVPVGKTEMKGLVKKIINNRWHIVDKGKKGKTLS